MPEQNFSRRQLRIANEIKRALTYILVLEEFSHPELPNTQLTIVNVIVSRDLRVATIFISCGNDIMESKKAAKLLQLNTARIRFLLTNRVNMKYSPKLHFLPTETMMVQEEYEQKISDLIEIANKK